MRPVIALAGLAGCGKSTIAAHLAEEHNFRRVRFADPLKDMMRALGLSEREIEGDLKETPCPLLGYKTPRHAMVTIGTEWGREMIAPDLWIRAWQHNMETVPPGVGVVCEDCRFPNEAAAVRRESPFALVVRIERPGIMASGHISELQAFPVDITLVNDGSVADLLRKASALILERVQAVPAM